MKKNLFSLLLFLPCMLEAQPPTTIKYYRCVVVQLNGTKVVGEIYKTADSGISILRNSSPQRVDTVHAPVNNIDIIKIRRKGNTGKGWFYGGLAGGVTGTVIGLMIPLKQTNFILPHRAFEQTGNVLAGLGIGAISGGLLGVLISSASIKIRVHGNKKVYGDKRKAIIRYSLMQK